MGSSSEWHIPSRLRDGFPISLSNHPPARRWGFTGAQLEIFPGTMQPQRSGRRKTCLSAKRELVFRQRSEDLHGRKKILSPGEIPSPRRSPRRPLQLLRPGEAAGDGRRRGHRRSREIDLAPGMAHPPDEIPVRRRDRPLPLRQDPHVAAETGAAGRQADHRRRRRGRYRRAPPASPAGKPPASRG